MPIPPPRGRTALYGGNMGTKALYGHVEEDLQMLSALVKSLEGLLQKRDGVYKETPQSVWQDFAEQPSEQRAATIKSLTEYLDILMYAEAQVRTGKEQGEKQLLWHVIKYLGLVPPDDLFDRISQNHFIEIYNDQGIQVYRNLEFCKIVSYSIAEMSVYRWDQLYNRDSSITNLIITDGVQRGFSGTRELFKLHIPIHRVSEVFGGRNREFTAEFGLLCPLVDKTTKSVTHILSTCNIVPLDQSKKTA